MGVIISDLSLFFFEFLSSDLRAASILGDCFLELIFFSVEAWVENSPSLGLYKIKFTHLPKTLLLSVPYNWTKKVCWYLK